MAVLNLINFNVFDNIIDKIVKNTSYNNHSPDLVAEYT